MISLVILSSNMLFAQWEWFNPLPQGNVLWDVYFVDEHKGWSVGPYGTVINTSDGGENWSCQDCIVHKHLYGVHFTDYNNGWAVGDQNTIIHTSDGGETWEQQEGGADYSLRSVFFIDTDNGWVVGSNDSDKEVK